MREMVILVKPQFELEREQVGKGGIIRDPALHRRLASAWKTRFTGWAFKLISFRLRFSEPKGIRSSSYMPDIRVVGIMAKPGIPHASAIVSELVEWLHARGVESRLDPETAAYLGRADGLPATKWRKARNW